MAVPRAGEPPRTVDVELHPSLAFAVAWPGARLGTTFARNLLPLEVPFADAVENPRRLGLLLEGLRRGDPELLQLGSVDHLHVPYRLAHVPGGEAGMGAAREAGAFLATLSGSGTALFAIADAEHVAGVAEAMAAAFRDAGEEAVGRVVEVVHRPAEPVVV
jgi:homoserine kinase